MICTKSITIGVEVISKNTSIRNRVFTTCSKFVYSGNICIRFCYTLCSCQNIATIIYTVTISVNNNPHMSPRFTRSIVVRAIVVTYTTRRFYPYTGSKSTIFFQLIYDCSCQLISTCLCRQCLFIEEIPFTVYLLPTTGKNTNFCIAVNACCLVIEYTCELCLTSIDAVFTKVIVVTVNFIYTSKLHAILIVCEATFFNSPTFFYNVRHCISIFECAVYIAEASTGFTRKIGIYERLKSVNFLVFGLKCKSIKCICSKICIVTKSTLVNYTETALSIPISIILGCKLDTCQHTKGICSSRIDSLSLVNPVKLKCQCICSFIKSAACQ